MFRPFAFEVLSKFVSIVYLSELSKKSQNPYSSVDLDNNMIFLHVPKTAGSAILKQKFGLSHHGHFRPEHYASNDMDKFKRSHKIAVVRNPWDRMVSAFSYLSQNIGDGKYAKKFVADHLCEMEKFESFLDKMISSKKYQSIVTKWDHFRPQWDFISYKDEYCVDLLGRFEELDEFNTKFCNKVGLSSEIVKKTNSSERSKYRDYYSSTHADFVYELYKTEIDYLDYNY